LPINCVARISAVWEVKRRTKGVGVRRVQLVLSSIVLLAGISAPAASSDALGCGSVVTSDVTLAAPLTNCPSHGLVIGADDVTVNLNGFSIEGAEGNDGVGVLVDGWAGVTVENGSIRGFSAGVELSASSASPSRVSTLTIQHTGVGVRLFGDPTNAFAPLVSITSAKVTDSGTGIACSFGVIVRIEKSYIARNSGAGIGLTFCGGGALLDNTVTNNGWHGLVDFQSKLLIERNSFNGNAGDGIFSLNSHSAFLFNVTNANGGTGLIIEDDVAAHGPEHTVTGHVANANGGYGIYTDLVGVVSGGKNRARANRIGNCVGVPCS
jgi:hypothetical protein